MINGLDKMSRDQIIAALSEIIADAATEADKLTTEIDQAYDERDAAESEMKAATARRDLETYREARIKFDLLTGYIAETEQRRDTLKFGRIIDQGDAEAIRRRLNVEIYKATGAAALRIIELFREMERTAKELDAEIGDRNKVVAVLNECTRPKDENGEVRFPEFYRDTTVGPYVRELSMMQNTKKSNFYYFVNRFKN